MRTCGNNLIGNPSFPLPQFSAAQLQMDSLVQTFSREATNGSTLAAMTMGGLAYRVTKLGVVSVGASGRAPFVAKLLAPLLGLSSEVTAFQGTERILGEAQGSFSEGWRNSFVDFGIMKGVGHLLRTQNLMGQHLVQDFSMVAGHQATAFLGWTPPPEGNFLDQMLHAEITNLQLGIGSHLSAHLSGHRISSFERHLDQLSNIFTHLRQPPPLVTSVGERVLKMSMAYGRAPLRKEDFLKAVRAQELSSDRYFYGCFDEVEALIPTFSQEEIGEIWQNFRRSKTENYSPRTFDFFLKLSEHSNDASLEHQASVWMQFVNEERARDRLISLIPQLRSESCQALWSALLRSFRKLHYFQRNAYAPLTLAFMEAVSAEARWDIFDFPEQYMEQNDQANRVLEILTESCSELSPGKKAEIFHKCGTRIREILENYRNDELKRLNPLFQALAKEVSSTSRLTFIQSLLDSKKIDRIGDDELRDNLLFPLVSGLENTDKASLFHKIKSSLQTLGSLYSREKENRVRLIMILAEGLDESSQREWILEYERWAKRDPSDYSLKHLGPFLSRCHSKSAAALFEVFRRQLQEEETRLEYRRNVFDFLLRERKSIQAIISKAEYLQLILASIRQDFIHSEELSQLWQNTLQGLNANEAYGFFRQLLESPVRSSWITLWTLSLLEEKIRRKSKSGGLGSLFEDCLLDTISVIVLKNNHEDWIFEALQQFIHALNQDEKTRLVSAWLGFFETVRSNSDDLLQTLLHNLDEFEDCIDLEKANNRLIELIENDHSPAVVCQCVSVFVSLVAELAQASALPYLRRFSRCLEAPTELQRQVRTHFEQALGEIPSALRILMMEDMLERKDLKDLDLVLLYQYLGDTRPERLKAWLEKSEKHQRVAKLLLGHLPPDLPHLWPRYLAAENPDEFIRNLQERSMPSRYGYEEVRVEGPSRRYAPHQIELAYLGLDNPSRVQPNYDNPPFGWALFQRNMREALQWYCAEAFLTEGFGFKLRREILLYETLDKGVLKRAAFAIRKVANLMDLRSWMMELFQRPHRPVAKKVREYLLGELHCDETTDFTRKTEELENLLKEDEALLRIVREVYERIILAYNLREESAPRKSKKNSEIFDTRGDSRLDEILSTLVLAQAYHGLDNDVAKEKVAEFIKAVRRKKRKLSSELLLQSLESLSLIYQDGVSEALKRISGARISSQFVKRRQLLLQQYQQIKSKAGEEVRVEVIPSKCRADQHFGYVTEDCTKNRREELKRPHFMLYRIIVERVLEGMVDVHHTSHENDRALILAFGPRTRLNLNHRELLKRLLRGFAFLAKSSGIRYLLISTQVGEQGNRVDMMNAIKERNYPVIQFPVANSSLFRSDTYYVAYDAKSKSPPPFTGDLQRLEWNKSKKYWEEVRK